MGATHRSTLSVHVGNWFTEREATPRITERVNARPGDRFEVPVDGFVIDIAQEDLLIEIQTRNFSSIKSKLTTDYPIVHEKMDCPVGDR
jgi:hypothetical protein